MASNNKKSKKATKTKAVKKAVKKSAPKMAAKATQKTAKKTAPKKALKKAVSKKATKPQLVKKAKSKSPKSKVSAAKLVVSKSATKPAAKKQSPKLSVSFTPLYDHVLIQQDGESDRTPGGLYIPAIAQDRPARGKVLAVGNGRKSKKGMLKPLDVRVGESVIYNQYSGSKITIEGAEFLILKESDVLAVVRD